MKRSEINTIMHECIDFLDQYKFKLPPFGFWSPEDWMQKGSECAGIVEQQLGWDITDFGSGDFNKVGLFLFTIRNGVLTSKDPNEKVYAEKIMIVKDEQVTPIHFHYNKMEDIINRGGGVLVIQLWNSDKDHQLADTDVVVYIDSVRTKVRAAGTIELQPGESVCLPPFLYHKFWGKKGCGTILVGEVSKVNDDQIDNHFYEVVGRFPDIEEDEKPLYLLYNDFGTYYKHAIIPK
jgi:D-lyxose ketol-isomerase